MTEDQENQDVTATKTGHAEFDAVRILIIQRCGELRLSYADVSRQIDRNETYIHQFLFRGTPKVLPEDVRAQLALALDVQEESLRGIPRGRGTRMSSAASAAAFSAPAPVQQPLNDRDVPTYSETGSVTLACAKGWSRRPPQLTSVSGAFAIWVSRKHGSRFNPGDLIFVHPAHPPRVGDPVVVLRDTKIVAIGDLTNLTAGQAHIATGDTPAAVETIRLEGVEVLKVVATQFA